MKLKYNDLTNIAHALKDLDGCTAIVKENGEEVSCQIPYNFDGGTILKIAKNEAIIREELKTFQDAAKKYKEDSEKLSELLDQEIEVEFKTIKPSDLKLDENKVPPTMISFLSPIIEGFDDV